MKGRKNQKIIAVVIGCVVAAALIACGLVLFLQAEHEKKAHTPLSLSFSFEAPEHDPLIGSGVPIRIEGTDLDGEPVSENAIISEEEDSVMLLRGEYDITVVGSPVSVEGNIYSVPNDPFHLLIEEGRISLNGRAIDAPQDGSSDYALPAISLTSIKPENVTDAEIEAVRAWMKEYDVESDSIDEYVSLIEASRTTALEQVRVEELEAWRTKVSGDFGGTGIGSPGQYSISASVDGDKLIVTGNLQKIGSMGYSGRANGQEWHFVLTSNTVYGGIEEDFIPETRSQFLKCFPNSFVSLSITVDNGYVTKLVTSA